MTTTINASTSAGLVQTADTSGVLALQTAGTTAVSISASQVVTLTNALPVASGGTGQITANASFNAIAPSQTSNSGKYLTTDGTNTSWGTVSAPSAATPTALGTVYGKTDTTQQACLGYQAGNSSTGNAIVAVGYRTLYVASNANNTTALGYQAGVAVTSGGENVLVGENCASTLTTGNSSIVIGSNAQVSGSGVTNEIVIGKNANGKGSNTGFISPNSGGVYQGNNSSSWSTTSDRRLKKNIVDNTEGLEKITAIRVRNFEYKLPVEVTELDSTCAVQREGVQLGVIAQELQEICPDCVKTETTGVISVDSDNIFWHMVNAIKDLKVLNDTLTARITALEGN